MPGPSGTTPKLGLPYPTPDDSVDVPRDVKALADKIDPMGMVPVGAMMMWLTAAPPAGWALCHGQTVPAVANPGLAALLGATSGNVTLPNLQGRLPLGYSPTHALGSTGGQEAVALSPAQMPAHAHGVSDPTHIHAMRSENMGGNQIIGADSPNLVASAGGVHPDGNTLQRGVDSGYWSGVGVHAAYTGIAIQNNGGNEAHQNMPPFLTLNFIIRLG